METKLRQVQFYETCSRCGRAFPRAEAQVRIRVLPSNGLVGRLALTEYYCPRCADRTS